LKSNIGPGAAAAIVVVIALVIVGLLWKVYFGAPPGATKNPYNGAPAGMRGGGPPPGTGYQERGSMRPGGPGAPGGVGAGGPPGGYGNMSGGSGGPSNGGQ
jgi:hypothetical protein